MKKSIIFILGSLFFTSSVSAEYLGLGEVPVGDADLHKVMIKAIDQQDFSLINNWYKDLDTSYTNNDICVYYHGSTTKISNKNYDDNLSDAKFASLFMSNKGESLAPTKCENIILWRLTLKMQRKRLSPLIPKLLNTKYDYPEDIGRKYLINRQVVLDVMEQTPNSQYQVFYPIIDKDDYDPEIRQLALDKFLSGYKNREQTDPEFLKKLKVRTNAISSNPKLWNTSLRDDFFFSINDPLFSLLHKYNYIVLNDLYKYSDSYKNKPNILPPFNKEIIARGGYTDQEIKKMNLGSLSRTGIEEFYNVNISLRIWHKIYKAYLEEHDLNTQMPNGNTLFMEIFSDRNTMKLRRNIFAGAFVRFYLENGANPLLENKDAKTAYSIFINDNGSSEVQPVRDAFLLKEYDFKPTHK